MFAAAVLLLLFHTILAENPGSYQYPKCCPDIKPMDLDYDKYQGVWVDYYHTDDNKDTCSVYDYQKTPDGYNMLWTGKDLEGKDFNTSQFLTFGESQDPRAKGKYMMIPSCTEPSCGITYLEQPMYLFVLKTNYDDCALEYACSCDQDKKQETMFLQCREGQPPFKEEDWRGLLKQYGITGNMVYIRNNC